MLSKYKVVNPEFPRNEFNQAIDLSLVCSVYDNGGVIDVRMENGEKIRIIRDNFDYDTFVDGVNTAKAKKQHPHL